MRKINTCTFWLVFVTSEVVLSYATKTSQNPVCEKVSPLLLGPLMVLQTEDVPKLHPGTNEFKEWYGPNDDNGGTYVEKGGSSKPHSCQTHWPKVAIIVPYRDRAPQLEAFLFHIHPVLQRQQLDYRIFVIEQSSDEKFNRASLMNVGFVESNRIDTGFTCFIFHDVDLLPEDDRNMYVCPKEETNQAKHISVAVNKWKYRLQYKKYFGGVTALSKSQVKRINGFSNEFYGWGGEDDDILHRIEDANITVFRQPANIARFTMLLHGKETANKDLTQMMEKSKEGKHFSEDGLNSLRYELLQTDENLLYTRILVKLPPAPKVLKKKHWLDIAGGSIKHTIDGAFKNMASAVANKVVDWSIKADDQNQEEESGVY